MASRKPFIVDDMTVEEILNMGDDQLSKMDKRELSRAVRTTALAANKRLNRLKKQAKKEGGKYVEKKSAKHAIAMDALNSATNNGKCSGKFGVGNKNRNQLLAEFSRIKHFMNLKTSTLKGAEDARKKREKNIFGKTREEAAKQAKKEYSKGYKKATGKKPTKKKIEQVVKRLKDKFMQYPKKVWELFNKHQEIEHLQDSSTSSYFKGYAYEEVIEEIGSMVMEGEPEDKILQKAQEIEEQKYIEEQEEYLKEVYSDFGLSFEMSQDPFEF